MLEKEDGNEESNRKECGGLEEHALVQCFLHCGSDFKWLILGGSHST